MGTEGILRRPALPFIIEGTTNVIDIRNVLKDRSTTSLRQHSDLFYNIAESHSLRGQPVNPADCMGPFPEHIATLKSTAAKLKSDLSLGNLSREIKAVTLGGADSFVLVPNVTSQWLGAAYTIFIPEPNHDDPRIIRVLEAVGCQKTR